VETHSHLQEGCFTQLLANGVFLSPDWPDDPNMWLAFSKSVADHRCNILDVNLTALLGDDLKSIVQPEAR